MKKSVIISLILIFISNSSYGFWSTELSNGDPQKALNEINARIESVFKSSGGYSGIGKMLALAEYGIVLESINDMQEFKFGISVCKDAISKNKIPEALGYFLTWKAQFLSQIGDYGKAIEAYNNAYSTSRNPDNETQHNLALLLASCPVSQYRDGEKALELGRKAVSIQKSMHTLPALAAAYAETGNFNDAIEIQTAAITLAKLEMNKNNQKSIFNYERYLKLLNEQLDIYKANRPWRMKSNQ